MSPEAVETVLARWPETAGGTARLINLSENHTFRIDGAGGERHVLRVHRPGYHDAARVESELAWMAALREAGALETPRPIPGRDGALVQAVCPHGDDEQRLMVLFAFEPGNEPREDDDLRPLFAELGRLSARAHAHVIDWPLPAGFTRPVWDAAAILDADGLWGDWRAAPGVEGAHRKVLETLDEALRESFWAYGRRRDRFGLIHADMRLANLLVDDGHTRVIDFDDCGFGWFVYDFGAAVSFFEDSPEVPALRDAWIAGYEQERPLERADVVQLDAAVLLRRMALLAWINSHAETDLAARMAPHFADGSATLADRWLTRGTI